MPELPEVETIRRALEPALVGRTIVEAGSFASAKFNDARLADGATIAAVQRRGKYLIMPLDTGSELIVHLGMTGVLRHVAQLTTDDTYLRAWWRLDDHRVFEFSDVRRFGRIAVVPAGEYAALPTLAALGPEPFSDAFDARTFHRALNRSNRAIKTQLLSQRPVAGIGNIYADEACWMARVRPSARTISQPAAIRLHDAIREVLADAINRKGTTLRDYRTVDGGYGENQDHLLAYGRFGYPCQRCGTPLRRSVIDTRTTTHCPKCQRR